MCNNFLFLKMACLYYYMDQIWVAILEGISKPKYIVCGQYPIKRWIFEKG